MLAIDTTTHRRLIYNPVDQPGQAILDDSQLTAIAVIPARFGSTRLRGKPLLEIGGRALIVHTIERALSAKRIARAIVATDDKRIVDVVRGAGFEAVLTRSDHTSGSDRLAEVAQHLEADVIVNVQGDEPFIAPATIDRVIEEMALDPSAMITTASEPILNTREVLSPHVVKVVVDGRGRALYFSRSPIPYPREAATKYGALDTALEREPDLLKRFRRHTGLYAYRRQILLEYARWPKSKLETAEQLEQLRALEHGLVIKVIEVDETSIGIDTEGDLERARALVTK